MLVSFKLLYNMGTMYIELNDYITINVNLTSLFQISFLMLMFINVINFEQFVDFNHNNQTTFIRLL